MDTGSGVTAVAGGANGGTVTITMIAKSSDSVLNGLTYILNGTGANGTGANNAISWAKAGTCTNTTNGGPFC